MATALESADGRRQQAQKRQGKNRRQIESDRCNAGRRDFGGTRAAEGVNDALTRYRFPANLPTLAGV